MRGTQIVIANNRILAKSARRTFRPHRRKGVKTPVIEVAKAPQSLHPEAIEVLKEMEKEKWKGHLKAAVFLTIAAISWLVYTFL